MNKPADYLIRQSALDVCRSFIVKAPAGSGKTTLLVKRYLRLLTTVNDPEEVIAITFTRKAASEMVSRVLEALAQTADAQSADDTQLLEIASAVRQHDKENKWDLLSSPSRLRIQTIDALSQRLVRQMPWSAGFGAAPSRVADDVMELYQQAAKQTLLSALADQSQKSNAEQLLLALDNDFTRVCKLLVSMLARRDQWQKLLLQEFSADDVRQRLMENWQQSADHMLSLCSEQLSNPNKESLLICGRYAAKNLSKVNPDSPICALKDVSEFPQDRISDIEYWRAFYELLFTNSGSLRKTINKTNGFPTKADGGDDAIKNKLIGLLDSLRDTAFAGSIGVVGGLPDSAFTDQEWQLFSSLVEVLKYAIAELTLIFQQKGICDHIEIATRANAALGEEDKPTDLSLRLDYQIKHLLIDEFQDTSHTQMDLFHRLTAGWQPDEGRTVFFVGDPMQSIYRFREADVGIFLNAFATGFQGLNIENLELTENFRSSEELVDWTNKTFTSVFPLRDDRQSGAVKFTHSTAFKQHLGDDDKVKLHLVDKQTEADRVVDLVSKLVENQNNSTDIAVLVRSRTHLTEIISQLKEKGISHHGLKLDRLSNRSCIQDILALTMALTHPGDKLSWLSVLRAPWCGVDLVDLTYIAQAASDNTVWQVMQSLPVTIKPANVERIQRLNVVFSAALSRVGKMPLHLLVADVWQAIGGPDTVKINDLPNIKTYLQQLVQVQLAGQIKNLAQLERAIEELWAVSIDSAASIKLMTMHNAKGLEFDIVILPGLYKRPRTDDSKLLIWNEYLLGQSKSSLLVSPIKTQENDNKRYNFIKNLDSQAQIEENKRLLYVACTRAKQQLHLLVNDKPDSSSLQAVMQNAIENEIEKLNHPTVELTKLTQKQTNTYRRLPLTYTLPQRPVNLSLNNTLEAGPLVEYQWAGVSAKHIGTVIHEIIYAVAENKFDVNLDRRRWRNKLLSMGVDHERLSAAMDQLELVVENIHQEHRAKWILSANHTQINNEWPLSADIDGGIENIIIDRTFIDEDGIRWIIDYKTSVHEGGNIQGFLDSEVDRYRAQLEKYAMIIRLHESHPINLGLYFPLLGEWREWQYVD